MSGYQGSKNVCDFGMYLYPHYYYIETKSTNENTFPLAALTQYDKLLERKGRKGVRSGVVLWIIPHDKVFYIPIATFEKLKRDGKKSFNVKYQGSTEYQSLLLPSKKKRVFLSTDYSPLLTLPEGW